MGSLVDRKIDELKWNVAGVLLFFGISAPALHRIFKNEK